MIDATQSRAARVVGFCYLFAMTAGVFGESYVRGRLVVANDAVQTARNILAHEQLFRLGIAAELLTFVSDIVLITALFVILERVHRPLALLAAFFRIAAASVLVGMTLTSLDALRLLRGAEYLKVFGPDQLQALARASVGAHRDAFTVGFIYLGLGSMVFALLWLRSRYVPRPLAALGILGSAMLAAGCFAIVIVPSLAKTMGLAFMMPLGLFEVSMGFLLLFRGLREA